MAEVEKKAKVTKEVTKATKTTEKKDKTQSMEETFKKELSFQFYEIFKKAEVSEKATRLMEFENKLVFEVIRPASKPMIKLLVENQFGKKVKSVNTINSIKGTKKAIVTFNDEGVASELGSELGLV